jgi:hypothetical protein
MRKGRKLLKILNQKNRILLAVGFTLGLLSACADKGQLLKGSGDGSASSADSSLYGPAVVGDEAQFFIEIDGNTKMLVNSTPKNTLEYAWVVEAQLGSSVYQFSLRYFSFGTVNQTESRFEEIFKTSKSQINLVRSLHTGQKHVVLYSADGIKTEAVAGGLLITVTDESLVNIFAREKPLSVRFVTPGANQNSSAEEIVKVEYH